MLKPMLAAPADLTRIKFPVICSPKLDGIRATIQGGKVLSRSLKPIPNRYIQECLGREELNGLDGELIVGLPYGEGVFARSTSGVMSQDGEPDFTYYVFDMCDLNYIYETRYGLLNRGCDDIAFTVLTSTWIYTAYDLSVYEDECVEKGYEGIIIRDPQAFYKHGRSTVREGGMLKLKRFSDSEAVIISMDELMHNENEATTNELGRTARASNKENLVPWNTMGALRCRDMSSMVEFSIGTGFSAAERKWFWEHRMDFIHSATIVKYGFLDYGVKELPRHPKYLGLRDKEDMG